MNESTLRWLRMGLAAETLVVGCLFLAQLFGAKVFGCGLNCTGAGSFWFSPFAASAVLILSVADVALLLRADEDHFRVVAWAQGAAAVVMLLISIGMQVLCPLCVAVQLAWAALALTTVHNRFTVVFAASLGAGSICVLTASSQLAMTPVAAVPFTFRPYEGRVVGSPAAVVVFTDPTSLSCREAESKLSHSTLPVPVLHRWYLLPEHRLNAIKLAALIESIDNLDYRKGRQLEAAIARGSLNPSKVEVVEDDASLGFDRETVGDFYDHPEATSMSIIRSDAEFAAKLGVTTVPEPYFAITASSFSTLPYLQRIQPSDVRQYSTMTKLDYSALNVYFPR